MKRNRKRYALAALLAFVFATASFAFAASNTVGPSNAGDGQNTVSGFTVSAVSWTLDATNPANISGLQFTIAPAAASVRVALDQGSGYVWLPAGNCSVSGGTSVTCTPAAGSVGTLALVGLRVAAAS